MSNPYLKGSEWRKWDLHVHAPQTKTNDQYNLEDGGDVWSEFCKKIEESDVSAFGITDYFSANNYFTFIQKFNIKYPQSNKVFFPNIELRTSNVVNAAQEEVNLHLIFNPDISEIETKIKTFLQNLETNKTADGGRHIKASELSTEAEYEEATTTREFIKKAFKDTFGDKASLTDFLLIFTAANNDGIRAEAGKKRKAVITDELDKFSNGFFGNSGNVEYFLGKNRLENKEEVIDPKPVVTGCDAHSFLDLENLLGKLVPHSEGTPKEPTWIKADLTFEGLKQIIYEPASRVFIGLEPEVIARVRTNQTKYIKALHINQISGYDGRHGVWFKDERIELNQELVAVIGNKGSGKSAVTDIIGLLGNSHNQKQTISGGRGEELFSFLNKNKFLKNNCAANFTGEMHWHGGLSDQESLNADTDESIPEKVEYLPQKYLEKICANIEDDEFRKKLSEVIFGYVEDKDRFGKSDLDGLIAFLTNQAAEDIKTTKDLLQDKNESVVEIEKKLTPDYRREIEDKIKNKEGEITAHAGTNPSEVPKPTKGDENITKVTEEIDGIDKETTTITATTVELEKEQKILSLEVENLKQAKQAVKRQIEVLNGLKTKYEDLLSTLGIRFEDIVNISVNYEKIDQAVETKEGRLDTIESLLIPESEIRALGLTGEELAEAVKNSLICQLAVLAARKKIIVDSLDKPEREFQDYLVKKTKWDARQAELLGNEQGPTKDTLNWLRQELAKIYKDYPATLKVARLGRDEIAKIIFVKKKELVSFYNSVKKSIDQEIKKHGDDLGDYDISIDASLRFDASFYDEFFKYINQSVKGSFHGAEDGKAVLKKLCEGEWQDPEEVFAKLNEIIKYIDEDHRSGLLQNDKVRDIFKQLKLQKDPVDFYNYVFGFEYLQTKYDLKVDGKDLSELSPGERGGLLLIFYLMLDKRDIPLVIDQPEDNLDNKSVYEILVTFLKKAKKRRQIIMVTHNPNLAVVADAEQIIHVSIDKKGRKNDFDFYSGSIENPQVNKGVVDILEGTMPAFNNRRLKYRQI